MPPKSKKDPAKPKGVVSAYAWFVKDKQGSVEVPLPKDGNKKAILAERSKILSGMWKKMTEDDKAEYQAKATKDKQRHGKEMAVYRAQLAADGDTKKSRKLKDKTRPKKNLVAFFFFSNKTRPKLKEKNPELKVGDLSKLLGEQWKSMSDKEKEPFVKEAEKDKKRYDYEMELWRQGKFSRDGEEPVREEDDEEDEEEEEDEDYSDAED